MAASTTTLLWRSSTTRHDWNDGAFLRALLERATGLGLLGPITWCQLGTKGRRQALSLPRAVELVAELPLPSRDAPSVKYLEAGGEAPFPFSLTLSVALPDRVGGPRALPSMAWLHVDERAAPAEALAQAFRAAHSPDDTEYAFIHPEAHWNELTGSVYRNAVTIGSMFTGVLWANFLGPGHVERFDRARLAELRAFREAWTGDRGLHLLAAESPRAAASAAGVAELVRLTEAFHAALR